MEKAKLFTTIKYVLFLVVGLGIVYYLFHLYYTPSFVNDLENVNLTWLAVSVCCAIVANVFRTLRWQLMIEPLVNKKPSFINVFNALMVGYLVNLALPRAGELARCGFLSKKEQINIVELVGSVIAERIFDVLMLLLLVLCSLFLYQDLFSSLIDFNIAGLITQKSLFIISALVIIGLLVTGFLIILAKKKHPFIITIKTTLLKLRDGFISVKKIKSPFGFVVFTLAIWVFYIASSYFAFKMLQQTELLTFADALLCVVAGSFGMIAPIQGGIGAFHYMVTKCLTLLGIDSSPALVYATVLHASQTLLVTLLGVLAFLPSIRFSKRK